MAKSKEAKKHASLKYPWRPPSRWPRPSYYANKEACCASRRQWAQDHKTDLQRIMSVRLATAKRRASKRSLAFDLTLTHLQALYDKTPYCAVTGMQFDLNTKYGTISIDRIDSTGGYTIGNVRLVRWQVNAALQDWGIAPFTAMCCAVAARQQERT